jgi:ethanolamine ammonia-lyase small subunit
LAFQLAHARARDAVYAELDPSAFPGALVVSSAARSRDEYLLRPDLGRRLADVSLAVNPCDLLFVVADGLSARAAQRHAGPLIAACQARLPELSIGPLVVATQARVAIGDEIGQRIGARSVAVLIGERPGLTFAESLGAYLTFDPKVGRTDAERNCLSNIHDEGMPYELAADKLAWLVRQALVRGLTGVELKEDAIDYRAVLP